MEIPFSTWYPAIARRRSRRQFDPAKVIPAGLLEDLRALCDGFRPFPCARAELVTERCEEAFRGAVGPYGKIKGAPAFIAFVGDSSSANFQEATGYTGEGIVLAATALTLSTCWVAGLFDRKTVASLVDLHDNERVLAVTPVGYPAARQTLEEKIMTGFGSTHKRKPLSSLVSGTAPEKYPEWVRLALEAARLSPSAVNRQPWHFHVKNETITVSVRTQGSDYNISKRLDCGIAMLHIETAALYSGKAGRWEFLDSPQVARFYL